MSVPETKPLLIAVDDDKDWMQMFKLLFENVYNYEVRIAWNARTARELARDLERPATILMDLHIEGEFGGVRLLKNMRRHARHPVVSLYMSGDAESKITVLGMGGAISYLVKPFDPKEVQVYVETITPELVETARSATRDPLTGLYNRRGFYDIVGLEFDLAVRNKTPTSVIFVDADKFKIINDVHGHDVGDEVIQEMARCIKEHQHVLRASDRAMRMGGDEFVALLPATNAEQARIVAERLAHEIAQLRIKLPDNQEVSVQVSIGVSTIESDELRDNDYREVLARHIGVCDTEMYKEKQRKGAGR